MASTDELPLAPMDTFKQERERLFSENLRIRRRPTSSTNATASEAAAIQESLSRTQNLLKSELVRVAAVQNAIQDDEQILRKTMDTQKSLKVKGAKRALTELERAQQHEHRVLMASIAFFWSVVFYILWCRILSRMPLLDQSMAPLQKLLSYIMRLVNLLHNRIFELVITEFSN
jgi:Sec20